jgi:hypothetical protein
MSMTLWHITAFAFRSNKYAYTSGEDELQGATTKRMQNVFMWILVCFVAMVLDFVSWPKLIIGHCPARFLDVKREVRQYHCQRPLHAVACIAIVVVRNLRLPLRHFAACVLATIGGRHDSLLFGLRCRVSLPMILWFMFPPIPFVACSPR